MVHFAFLGCFTYNFSRNADTEECGTSKKNLHKLMEKIQRVIKISLKNTSGSRNP